VFGCQLLLAIERLSNLGIESEPISTALGELADHALHGRRPSTGPAAE
jgi:hypothetical protein